MLLQQKLVKDLIVPYMVKSDIEVKMVNVINYFQLLDMYDKSLLMAIQSLNSQLLNENVFLFEAIMTPENLHWKIWKTKDEIIAFIMNMSAEIEEMKGSKDRMVDTGQQIVSIHSQLTNIFTFNPETMDVFVRYLNLLCQNLYTRKSQEFLLFIEHCISVDKWDMKLFQQIEVCKAPSMGNKVMGFFKGSQEQSKERDFYLTITSDGLLKTDNHLLESRISQMIPFTNQLTVECKTDPEGFITYIVQSCAHERMIINFYKDYTKVINFSVGLAMALQESSYSLPHRFKSYSPRRQNCASKLYNDGAGYYQDLYEELKSAKWQVCITGWMITPYFLLKRPSKIENKNNRLDGVLQELAQRGVKVYIIAFMEPKMFVNNDSEYVQQYMESLHPNIKVYRHPNDTIPLLWSHHEKMVIIDQEVGFMGGLDICWGRWDTPEHRLKDPGLLWDGLDYNNYKIKDIYEPRKYQETYLNRDFQPRMPWHDIALQFRGDVVLDLLRHFVQYWYYVKAQLLTDPSKAFNFAKKRYEQAFNSSSSAQKDQMKYYLTEIKKKEEAASFAQKLKVMWNGREEKLPELLIQSRPGRKVGGEQLQMCRSASEWSIGVRMGQHESSIHNAYQELIKESKEFIYIENQFFMGIENQIVVCLADRIARAYHNKEKFRVIVVMPLLPGFEGDIADPNSTVLRIQVHHQFQAILRGESSLFKRLSFIENLSDYIFFFGLRQSEMFGNSPVTEIIYVHSKLMIVDDKRAIIGSANINDRSLLGTRDSELACIIEENEGNILDLRCRLFNEHFGLSKEDTKNVLHPQIWNRVIQNAKNATLFYREVFGCYPDDTVTVAAEVEVLASKADPTKFMQGRGQLVGHAVQFPLQFMKDEDLRFKIGQKQYFAPEMSFT